MKMKRYFPVAITCLLLFSFIADDYPLPKGWIKRGESPDSYLMGVVKGGGMDGKNAATLKAKDPEEESWATLMQNIKPGKFAGHKIKFSGYIKTNEDAQWAVLWMRVDKPAEKCRLDNMMDRLVSADKDWTKCEVVMEVPRDAFNIAFGGMMGGPGQMWFCKLRFEIVPDSTPTTDEGKDVQGPKINPNIVLNTVPVNLDFSE